MKKKNKIPLTEIQRACISDLRKTFSKCWISLDRMKHLSYTEQEISDMRMKFCRGVTRKVLEKYETDFKLLRDNNFYISVQEIDTDLWLTVKSKIEKLPF